MKNKIYYAICCLIFQISPLLAQSKMTFFSKDLLPFWVYIDGKLQNQFPETNVTLDSLAEKSIFNYKLVFQEKKIGEIDGIIKTKSHPYIFTYSLDYDKKGAMTAQLVSKKMIGKAEKKGFWKKLWRNLSTPVPPSVLTGPEFYNYMSSVKAENWDSKRLEKAKLFRTYKRISVDQVRVITNLFWAENYRLEYLQFIYFYVEDKENFDSLIDTLKKKKNQELFQKYVKSVKR